MQEDIEHKSVALSIRAAKLTAQTLAKAMRAALRQLRKPPHGKQTAKQLARQNAGLTSIEITDSNIKGFERVARKYGVDFALKRGGSEPPRWLVFFKARDTDALTAAFNEFSKKTLARQHRPSVREALRAAQSVAARAQQPKQRERGGKDGPVR